MIMIVHKVIYRTGTFQMIFKKYKITRPETISIWDNHIKPTDDRRDQGLKSLKILRAIRVDLNIYDITPPSRLSLGSMLLTEIQAPSVSCVT